jgi:hypothetical protein
VPQSTSAATVVPQTPQTGAGEAQASQAPVGGRLYGTVKSGNTPLPGVTVTAQNTLTGKRFSTTTDIAGAWQMNIPQNGRYVIRTGFAAFAVTSHEALLNATNREQTVNFELVLASRMVEQKDSETASQQVRGAAVRQLAGNRAESLSLTSALVRSCHRLQTTLISAATRWLSAGSLVK